MENIDNFIGFINVTVSILWLIWIVVDLSEKFLKKNKK